MKEGFLMDINQKKTALDDDSILYQKRDDSIGKKDISGLSGRQRLQYFKDYYLKFCILAIVLLVVAVSLIYTIFFRHQETVLSIAVLNDTAISNYEDLTDYLQDYYQADGRHQLVTVSNYYLEDPNQQMAFTTKLVTGDIDIVICDEEIFASESASGFYQDLTDLLSPDASDAFSSHLVLGHTEERDNEDQITSTGPELPYGVDIADTPLYTFFGGTAKEAILCVTSYSEHTEAAISFLDLAAKGTTADFSSTESEAAPAESQ